MIGSTGWIADTTFEPRRKSRVFGLIAAGCLKMPTSVFHPSAILTVESEKIVLPISPKCGLERDATAVSYPGLFAVKQRALTL